MERNLINNKKLKENIANNALNILERGRDYNDLTYTTVQFGYLFDIDNHGLECIFKVVTDLNTFYFAVQGERMMNLNFSEELYQATINSFLDLHSTKPEEFEEQNQPSEEERDEAPGWDAIDAECDRVYPNQPNPMHIGTVIKWMFGGNDPLDGISIYDGGDYWHFVTYGLSELYLKESDNEEYSGYGMEFTFKLKKDNYENEEMEIKGICGILQAIARITFNKGEIFEANQYLYTGQQTGIDTKQQSNITGFITASDDKFQTLNTPFGKVEFVEFIGVTRDEIEAVKDKRISVTELREKLPSDVTDYHRASVI